MNIHQITRAACVALSLLPTASLVQAENADPANMVIYISPQEYKYSVKLWHFYYDYWFNQGPAVEPVATQILGSEFGNVGMCEGNTAGKTLVWIKPSMFYNPHMQTFYGKITANVFTGSGKPLGVYVGESQKMGFLDVFPASQIDATYKLAMQNVAEKMKADQALQAAISKGVPANETSTPCAMVSLLPAFKNPAM